MISDIDVAVKHRQRLYEQLIIQLRKSNMNDTEKAILETLVQLTLFRKKVDAKALPYMRVPPDILPDMFALQQAVSISESFSVEESSIILILCMWNDRRGPVIQEYFPSTDGRTVEDSAIQIFNAACVFYDEHTTVFPCKFLIAVDKIGGQACALLDIKLDAQMRGGSSPFMLIVIAPSITYVDSLQISEILTTAAIDLKKGQWNIHDLWERIITIFNTRPFHYIPREL